MVVEYDTDDTKSKTSSQEVEVTLSYESHSLTFPINPDNLKQVIDSNSTTEEIEAIGQVSIPQRPSLSTIEFSSFFWADRDEISTPMERVKWIKDWQKSRKPAWLSVTSIDWNMQVTCESFSYWVNAGEEKDIYFTISLMEYRSYGAKQVRLVGNQYILEENGIQTVVGTTTIVLPRSAKPALPDSYIVATSRETLNKRPTPISVMVGEDESVVSLTKRYDWREGTKGWKTLYNENKETVAETIVEMTEAEKQAKANKEFIEKVVKFFNQLNEGLLDFRDHHH